MSSDYHMLDTNIILSSVLPNDNHKENVERYLKKNTLDIGSFKKNISHLNNFLRDNICITFVSKGVYEDDFVKMGIHKKDAELLDEAYLLHLMLNSTINFVTFDKGILKLKNKILNEISNNIVVSDPIEFVSVNN